MKEILKIIQNHWLMPQNIVWCGGWHLYEEACEQQQKTHTEENTKKLSSLYCVSISTFKNMMLKVILVEQNKLLWKLVANK